MRATLVVIDSLGVGAMPDAADWGDAGSNTLSHVAERAGGLRLPQLQALGLGNITHVEGVSPTSRPSASWGRASIASAGKDTISGHWEMAGVPVMSPFITFPEGFPPSLMEPFTEAIGRGALGNCPASGTVIIEELGAEHMATGCPIVYTSADSVFQIAAHEEIVPLAQLYAWCQIAFELVVPAGVARVIARPFTGSPGSFVRTTGRRDFSLQAPQSTLADQLKEAGQTVTGVGKVRSIFGDRGFSRSLKAGDNASIHRALLEALDTQSEGLIFANYVDFDQKYGHRRDPLGYARALETFDEGLPDILSRMGPDDLLILTADHGCDPVHPGTDHTREYVPILAWSPGGEGRELGTRETMADMGASIAEWLELGQSVHTGVSFLAPRGRA